MGRGGGRVGRGARCLGFWGGRGGGRLRCRFLDGGVRVKVW